MDNYTGTIVIPSTPSPLKFGPARRHSETLTSLLPALVEAKKEFSKVLKTSKGQVGSQKTRYSDLAEVISSTEPALLKHGLVIVGSANSDIGNDRSTIAVELTLYHTSGEYMSVETSLIFNPSDAMRLGSALTYLRRYLHLLLLDLAPDDDDDGAAASPETMRNTPKAAPEQDEMTTYVLGVLDRLGDPARIKEAKARLVAELGLPNTIKTRGEFDAWYKSYVTGVKPETEEETEAALDKALDELGDLPVSGPEPEATTFDEVAQEAPTQVPEPVPSPDTDLVARVANLLASVAGMDDAAKKKAAAKIKASGLNSKNTETYTLERIEKCEQVVAELSKDSNTSLYDKIMAQDANTQGEILESLLLHELDFNTIVDGTMSPEDLAIAGALVTDVLAGY